MPALTDQEIKLFAAAYIAENLEAAVDGQDDKILNDRIASLTGMTPDSIGKMLSKAKQHFKRLRDAGKDDLSLLDYGAIDSDEMTTESPSSANPNNEQTPTMSANDVLTTEGPVTPTHAFQFDNVDEDEEPPAAPGPTSSPKIASPESPSTVVLRRRKSDPWCKITRAKGAKASIPNHRGSRYQNASTDQESIEHF